MHQPAFTSPKFQLVPSGWAVSQSDSHGALAWERESRRRGNSRSILLLCCRAFLLASSLRLARLLPVEVEGEDGYRTDPLLLETPFARSRSFGVASLGVDGAAAEGERESRSIDPGDSSSAGAPTRPPSPSSSSSSEAPSIFPFLEDNFEQPVAPSGPVPATEAGLLLLLLSPGVLVLARIGNVARMSPNGSAALSCVQLERRTRDACTPSPVRVLGWCTSEKR